MTRTGVPLRDYVAVRSSISIEPTADREARMKAAVDALWLHTGGVTLGAKQISWIGFYLRVAEGDVARVGGEMVLGPRRDKPACSPIGLHGMCGRSWSERSPVIVDDVRTLGGNYIACDPKDLSELVVPLFERDGTCWGVLDADSYDTAAFDERDVVELTKLVEWLGLSARGRARGVLRY